MARNPDVTALQHLKERAEYRYRLANVLNLEKGEYPGEGPYDIPIIKPVYELPEIKEWINFDQVLQDRHPEGKAVHFFVEDYRFERIWNSPEKYLRKLKRYVCITSPEFSVFGDMPFVLQIYNHYRKHWVAAFMQEHGIKVIPTITPNLNPKSLEWFLDGEPHDSIVIMSSRRVRTEEQRNRFFWQYGAMVEGIHPSKVLLYGSDVPGIEGNYEVIKPYTETALRKRVPNVTKNQTAQNKAPTHKRASALVQNVQN